MKYTSRGLTRRSGTDKWEVTLSHRDPLTGELVRSFHTVEAKTQKKAEKARDELILELERKGSAYTSRLTLREFLERFIQYKESGMAIERSTANHYRRQAKVVSRYLGAYKLSELGIPEVSGWMAQMVAEGYAPRTISKPYGVLRQAMKHAVASYLGHSNVAMPCGSAPSPPASPSISATVAPSSRASSSSVGFASCGSATGRSSPPPNAPEMSMTRRVSPWGFIPMASRSSAMQSAAQTGSLRVAQLPT